MRLATAGWSDSAGAGWNLARVRRVRAAHNTFITGLEFLPTSDEAAPCRAFREASVISISVDHQVSPLSQSTVLSQH